MSATFANGDSTASPPKRGTWGARRLFDDISSLASLHGDLAKAEATLWFASARGAFVAIVTGAAFLAAVPLLALLAIAAELNAQLEWSLAASLAAASGGGLVMAVGLMGAGVRAFRGRPSPLPMTTHELKRNIECLIDAAAPTASSQENDNYRPPYSRS